MDEQFEFRVWDPSDEAIVDQFVDVIKEAFGAERMDTSKRKEQFLWYHKMNPMGTSIVTYAVDKESGLIAAIRPLWWGRAVYDGESYFFVQAVNASTRPRYQKLGLLRILTKMALEIASERKASFMYAFPNLGSGTYRGYTKLGAQDLGSFNYLVKPVRKRLRMLYLLLAHKDRLKRFQTRTDNFEFSDLPSDLNEVLKIREKWRGIWYGGRDVDYYRWRIIVCPSWKYELVENDDIIAFIRRGIRGDLNEIQLSEMLFRVEGKQISRSIKRLCQMLKERYEPDLISIALTHWHPYYNDFRNSGFYRAPDRTRLLTLPLVGCPNELKDSPWALSSLDYDNH